MEKMCSLDDVVEKTIVLCKDKQFRNVTHPFCALVDNYKIAQTEYELGKLAKSAPAWWEYESSRDLREVEKALKTEITEIVCSKQGKDFLEIANAIEEIECDIAPESCVRFQSELELF